MSTHRDAKAIRATPQLAPRTRRRSISVKCRSGLPQTLSSEAAQRRNRLATILAYHRFCCEHRRYPHTMSNQLQIMRWVDDRRIEMLAEGRPHWVPSMDDFEHAMWDCWDDLVKS